MFSIRQMIELTGLSEFTIRGWETRYTAFTPRRSDTGRREYSKQDIERALLFRELIKRGHKIGQIAQLKNLKLQELFELTEEKRHDDQITQKTGYVVEAMELMALQKWPELGALFKKIPTGNKSELIHHFILPALVELAAQIREGFVSVAQEHIFSSLLKEKIYSALSEVSLQKKSTRRAPKIRFVLATPEGDYHEIGLLIAHLVLRSHGMTSLYLGPNTPNQDLSETALRFEATHLLVVSTVSKKQGAQSELLSFVNEIQRKVGPELKILLAGRQAPRVTYEEGGSLFNMSSFQEFDDYLHNLKK